MRVFAIISASAASVSGLLLKKSHKSDPEPWACYMNEANQYMGTVAVSNSGQQCIQWSDAQKDADLGGDHFLGLTFGETGGAKLEGNFCRAFAADAKPWCFVKGFKSVGEAKQECDVPQCPTDGAWSRDFKAEAEQNAIKCTDEEGQPAAECDCSCVGVAGKALIQTAKGNRYCHCP